MGKILYNEKTILDAKNSVEQCNTAIIDAMEKIVNELMTIGKTLNTPNANKALSSYQESVNLELKYIKNMRDNYNNAFNIINSEYHDYSSNVEKTVGGSNGL